MGRAQRTRIRNIALCAIVLFVLYHILPDYYAPSLEEPGLDFKPLDQYMNDVNSQPHISAEKSSFAWNTVNFKYPPDTSPSLPPPFTSRPRIQHAFKSGSYRDVRKQDQRRREVKKVFQKAWNSYRKLAWMGDAMKPISGAPVYQFAGWAATLVDALDTLWIMGMRDEFYEAVQAVAKIDFGNTTARSVNTFETNIRYLGGLLAAYDLSGHEALRVKATEVGDLLYAGFNTRNNMPVDFIVFEDAKNGGGLMVEQQVVSASPGTITLEFARLSQITGNSKYYAAVDKVMNLFYKDQNNTKLPGMWPMYVSMSKEDVISEYQFTIGGNADSLYEYLPKAHQLLGSATPSAAKYESMSRTFMDTAMSNLFFRPMVPDNADILISGNCDVNEKGGKLTPSLDPESEHLSCFIGGLYALGGRLFNDATYLSTGRKLARGCAYAYKTFPTGIMPERYNMVKCKDQKNCRWDEKVWDEEKAKRAEYKEHLPKGFTTAKDPRYILRPEAIESVFVLWRITGEEEFREAAWDMFTSIAKATDTEYANAAIEDVSKVGSKQIDYMESFWMAETLKYFYLVFADPNLISLDDFVLNTEAHPFRLAKEKS